MLNPNRLKKIRKAIKFGEFEEFTIKYVISDLRSFAIKENSIDLVFSQAVMEHIIDVNTIYETSSYILKPNGYMSHQIDYKAHETHSLWYGHWTYSYWLWKLINYGRSYPINRYPHSYHKRKMIRNNFRIVYELPTVEIAAKNINKDILHKYKFIEDDFCVSSSYLLSQNII